MRVAQGTLRQSSVSIPAPIGGWNARDSMADMAPTDAVTMINWFPGTTEVILREGYVEWSTGLIDQVQTLMSYAGAGAVQLFGVAGGNIYDCTNFGPVGAASVSGLTNSKLQYQNVSTSGGDFMLCVNGDDKLQGYDGTSWWVDGDGSHDITGVDTTTINNITLFKNRIWMVQENSLSVWYLGTLSIAGAATEFPLQGVAQLGGYVVAAATWTIDAGYGVDDNLAFITSRGEIIVYKGTDPTSSTTWALIGVWRLGAPVGQRCLLKYQGDLLIISQDGVMPLSGALQSSRVNPRVALTDKIQSAVSNSIDVYGDNFGWQLLFFPKKNMLFLNVPINEDGEQEQYVMNTITRNWCQFQGWSANCWELFEDDAFFGGDGIVGRTFYAESDNGNNIQANVLQAFNYFGKPGRQKHFTLARPILRTSGNPQLSYNVNVDFNLERSTYPLSFSPTPDAIWDVSLWDSGLWGGDLSVQKNWVGVNKVGYCASTQLQLAAKDIQVRWVSTDLVFEMGSVL